MSDHPSVIAASEIGIIKDHAIRARHFLDQVLRGIDEGMQKDANWAAARQEWLRCFDVVLADAPAQYNFPAEHLPGFRTFLEGFATWMVNTA